MTLANEKGGKSNCMQTRKSKELGDIWDLKRRFEVWQYKGLSVVSLSHRKTNKKVKITKVIKFQQMNIIDHFEKRTVILGML